MTEEKQPAKEAKKCTSCGASSQDRVLLEGKYQDKKVQVCVRCLPALIHGAH